VSADTPIRGTLLRAFNEVRPGLDDVVASMVAQIPEEELADYDPDSVGQFLNALEALVVEALEDSGDEKRRFIFDTAIPAMVAQGQTAVDMARGHTTFFVALGHRVLERISPDECPGAEAWLSRFLGDYCAEVVERAIQAERELG
jgi:hypothetical protein